MEQPSFLILENITKTEFLSYIKTLSDKKYKYKTSKGIEYYQISASFDIETTSFYDNDNKCAVMYVWALCVEGRVYQGRTWNEYTDIMNTIAGILGTGNNTRFVVYVHNLAYEFQFLSGLYAFDPETMLLQKMKLAQVLVRLYLPLRSTNLVQLLA